MGEVKEGCGLYEYMRSNPIREIDFNKLNNYNRDWVIHCSSDTIDLWKKLIEESCKNTNTI